MSTTAGVLGRIVQHPIEAIEVLRLDRAPRTVVARCAEVSALCPVTAQPDLYTVKIVYDVHENAVIESKSLKLYLWKFRDRGISCEELAATIAEELAEQYRAATGKPSAAMWVSAKQQSRGGIALTATATA